LRYLTLEKEAVGDIKTTKAAIFLEILKNKRLASDKQFERAIQSTRKKA
tara:strand:+ start:287 stop:433 length:147 start_codon:yes stop_codon:yes gene_type:complete